MSVEPKRGCGFRKVGGLYLFGGGISVPCDRLPFALTVCTCCGQGIKQARGWTWIDPAKFFGGVHTAFAGMPCGCHSGKCTLCNTPEKMGRSGLLWIGEKFYKTPDKFVAEGVELGFSRRIKAIPQGFIVGETWVLLAHSKTIETWEAMVNTSDDPEAVADSAEKRVLKPGVFFAWKPERVEKICLESSRGTEEIAKLEKRGITPVFVPDEDKDHQGNVHDDFDAEKKAEVTE